MYKIAVKSLIGLEEAVISALNKSLNALASRWEKLPYYHRQEMKTPEIEQYAAVESATAGAMYSAYTEKDIPDAVAEVLRVEESVLPKTSVIPVEIGLLPIIFDTSGSVSDEELARAIGALHGALKKKLRIYFQANRIIPVLAQADVEITSVDSIEFIDPTKLNSLLDFNVEGRGGTSFTYSIKMIIAMLEGIAKKFHENYLPPNMKRIFKDLFMGKDAPKEFQKKLINNEYIVGRADSMAETVFSYVKGIKIHKVRKLYEKIRRSINKWIGGEFTGLSDEAIETWLLNTHNNIAGYILFTDGYLTEYDLPMPMRIGGINMPALIIVYANDSPILGKKNKLEKSYGWKFIVLEDFVKEK